MTALQRATFAMTGGAVTDLRSLAARHVNAFKGIESCALCGCVSTGSACRLRCTPGWVSSMRPDLETAVCASVSLQQDACVC